MMPPEQREDKAPTVGQQGMMQMGMPMRDTQDNEQWGGRNGNQGWEQQHNTRNEGDDGARNNGITPGMTGTIPGKMEMSFVQ